MKNYRILRIAGIHYSSVVERWLQDNPEFENSSYDEMLKRFFNSSIMYSDGFFRSFRKLGQDAYEIIVDFEIVQKQWATENGIHYDSNSWMADILMAQIEKIKPDIVYLQGTEWSIPGRFSSQRSKDNLIKILKEKFSFIRKIIVFSGYPSGADRIEGADIFFSSPPSIIDEYRKMGLDPILLYHSFDNAILSKLSGSTKKYGFTFAGTSRAPESRYWHLKKLMAETDLQAWIFEPPKKHNPTIRSFAPKKIVRSGLKKTFELCNDHWFNRLADLRYIPDKIRRIYDDIALDRKLKRKGPVIPLGELYPERCREPVMGLDMYNLLHKSIITFNKHTDQAWGCVGNMRMFEATGAGTCLVTDTGSNMKDLFEEDKEVVTYSSIDEAIEKVNYLMEHPKEAEKIAKAGQARTLKDHNVMNRCQQINEVIQKVL